VVQKSAERWCRVDASVVLRCRGGAEVVNRLVEDVMVQVIVQV
jgi:hypothetical protein